MSNNLQSPGGYKRQRSPAVGLAKNSSGSGRIKRRPSEVRLIKGFCLARFWDLGPAFRTGWRIGSILCEAVLALLTDLLDRHPIRGAARSRELGTDFKQRIDTAAISTIQRAIRQGGNSMQDSNWNIAKQKPNYESLTPPTEQQSNGVIRARIASIQSRGATANTSQPRS